jgi:hypothetical protein
MKQVYLVRQNGERLGPYEGRKFTAHREVRITTIDGWTALDDSLLEALGFRIEEALPEKIMVTREMVLRASSTCIQDGEWLWRALVEEASK